MARTSLLHLALVPTLILVPLAGGDAVAAAVPRSQVSADPEQDLIDLMPLAEDVRAQRFGATVDQLVREIGEDSFGGAYADGNGQLVVQTVGVDEAHVRDVLDTAQFAVALNEEIAIRAVENSWLRLSEITAAIPDLVAGLVGIDRLVRVGPDTIDNRVEVEVSADAVTAVAGDLRGRFGSTVVVAAGVRTTAPADYRRVDADPHKGGAKLSLAAVPAGGEAGNAACTSGFAFRRWSDGLVGMTTAGHCAALGTAWWNHQTYLGQVSRRVWSNIDVPTETDVEFIAPGSRREFAPRMWYGGRLTGIHWPVVGALVDTPAYVGFPIVFSGANSGVSVGEVEQVNDTECLSDGSCVNGMTRIRCVTAGYGGYCVQPGDSGGPCFSSKSGQPNTVLARGTIVAGVSRPGEDSWCTAINDVSAGLSASLVTASP